MPETNTNQYFDMGSIAAAGVSALGQIYGAKLSSKTQRKAVAAVNKANREMADLAWERNIDMWNRQNVYNSPSEQMKRLEEAGLNPNLIYGSSANAGNASSAPEYNAPTMQKYSYEGDFGVGAATQTVANSLMLSSQLAKMRSETEVNLAKRNTLVQDEEIKKLQVIYDQYRNSKSEVESEYWRDQIEATLDNLEANTAYTDSRTDAQNIQNKYLDDIYKQKVKLFTTNALQADYNFKNLSPLKKELLDHQIDYVIAQTAYVESRTEMQDLLNRAEQILQDEGVDLHGSAFERALINALDVLEKDPSFAAYINGGSGVMPKILKGLMKAIKFLKK